MAEPEKHFTIKRLAERWDVSDKTVRKRIDSGDIGCLRIGSFIRITKSQVEEYEARCSRNVDFGIMPSEAIGALSGQVSAEPSAFRRGAGIITLESRR